MTDATWRYASASAVGTSHGIAGTPCQDSYACRIFRDEGDEPVLAVAVSDGAGSATKSEDGSRITCATLLEQVEVFLDDGGRPAEFERSDAHEWLKAIREAIAEEAISSQLELRDYACTLLFALVADDASIFMQVGDGAIVVAGPDRGWGWVFWPERGEFANTTFFLTDDQAETRLQFDKGKHRIEELALFSDGIEALVLHYATKTVYAPFFERRFAALRKSAAAGQDLELSAELEIYLASAAINERTDDDKTLVLASRRSPEIVEETRTPSPSPHDTID